LSVSKRCVYGSSSRQNHFYKTGSEVTCTALEWVDPNCIKCALKWLLEGWRYPTVLRFKGINQSRALPLIKLKVLVLVRSYIASHHKPLLLLYVFSNSVG